MSGKASGLGAARRGGRGRPSRVRTLLWKNWLLKRRHPVSTLFEVALPCIYIVVMGQLKGLVDDVVVPEGWSDDGDDDTTTVVDGVTYGVSYNLYSTWGGSLGVPRFSYAESTLWGLLLYMGTQSITMGMRMDELSADDLDACQTGVVRDGMVDTNTSSPYRVPVECAGKVAPYKIAIAPDTPFTRDYFLATMDSWYPRIDVLNGTLQVPSLRQSVVFYETEDALAEYVRSSEYGTNLDNPHIMAGIVFDTYPEANEDIGTFQSIEYTLRLNSTRNRGGFVAGNIPRTYGDPVEVDPYQKSIETDYFQRYATTGFMTLQTLVTRFVNCMPVWDTETQSTNGTCQGAQPSGASVDSNNNSTAALSSSQVDEVLLESLENDILIRLMLRSVNGNSSVDLSTLIALLPTETREAFLTPLRQAPQPYLGSSVAPFPIESYTSSPFYEQVSNVFAIVFILSYLYSISRILMVFIQEKELRLREFMKILGVTESSIIGSWYITYLVIIFIGAILQAAGGRAGLFEASTVTLIFVFFFLFGLSVLAYGFFISAFFSRSRLGAFVGVVLFFLMYFVSAAFTADSPESSKNAGCLLSPVALALGVNVLADLESTGTGATWATVSEPIENFRLSTAMWMFMIDAVIYSVLGLYFEQVIPKEYGTTLKWYFPLSPSYWRSQRGVRLSLKSSSDSSSSGSSSPSDPNRRSHRSAADALLDNVVLDVNPNFEPVNHELREQEQHGEVLNVQRLRKVFSVPGGERVAVNGLSLVMYKNQITCLLGHNGAGKTTLISMLTGMTAPTSGNASFRGLSISNDMPKLRESLGICFQHDVLFAELTVEEHLLMFGRIKGFSGGKLQEVVDKQIREVGLTEKRNVKSIELSGGMKRKLSVAVSLLGDSSLVFLDEPTSGMDPYSRRSTWEILLNNRNDRVMVLTTHFMDEADILGDRIAIMAEGELRCCGSSLFLKNRFGAGYTLTLVKNTNDDSGDDSEVMSFITSYVPTALVLSNVGSEIAFQLPLASSPQFAAMFAELDSRLHQLGLLSYGVSVTTLEEVFIKVAEAADENNQHTLGNIHQPEDDAVPVVPLADDDESPTEATVTETPRRSYFGVHLRALILKRFRVAKRDKKAIIYSTALPIFLLLIGLGILRGANFTDDDPNLPLTTDAFAFQDQSPTPYLCQLDDDTDEPTAQWCREVFTEHFTGASAESVHVIPPAFNTSSPTVFNVTYTDPTIDPSGATGYELRLGEKVYKRGYFGDEGRPPIEGQYGAYLVYSEPDRNLFGYNLLINSTATHASIIFKALADQALYRFYATNVTGAANVDLKVNNHPLPLTASTQALFGSFLAFTACLFICIAFTFFPASIVVFLVKEKQSEHNSKHQQLVSGVSLGAFWLSNFVFDYLVYLVPCVCGLALIQIFNISSMTGGEECVTCTPETFPAVIVLFLTFGLAICPFNYCLSYMFKEHASSQSYTIIINFIIGVVLMVVSFMLDVIEETQAANSVLVFFWRLSPLFNLGYGLMNLVLNELTGIFSGGADNPSPFSPDVMGFEIIYLVFTSVLYFCLAVGIDYGLTFPKVKHWLSGSKDVVDEPFDEDEDVVAEAKRVASDSSSLESDIVTLKGLRKVYKGGKPAVRDLSFGLKRGECFGFLGINGAGKTTTMKMLTGDVLPTRGTASLNGFDILTQQMDVRRQIGYCPQFDALFELLTVREHLELFASIKGVSRADNELSRVVDAKIRQLNLGDFENKLAGSLSGGNKRKLSVAIAMIGDPSILFLDEPSTGMDPVSRRFMWDVISDVSTRGKASTVVLTTHSMEEAEALCSRVGIMVGGRLRCLGNIQHLKTRFGDGLVVDVKLQTPTPEEVEELVVKHFGGAESKAQGLKVDNDDKVVTEELDDRCRAFGDANLVQRIDKMHPTGYTLAAALERDGFVRASAFLSWCVEESRFDALHEYLKRTFTGDESVTVMERQNDFCRFKVRGDALKLSNVFATIEGSKHEMFIREYSVSQTTLEQIFNFFAAQQQEERGVARGMYQDSSAL